MSQFLQRLILSFFCLSSAIFCHGQDIRLLSKGIKFKYSVSSYNSQLQFTHNGNLLVFQHNENNNFHSFTYNIADKATSDTGILSKPNYIQHTDDKLQMMLTTVASQTLSPGHYRRAYTAVLSETGKQIDSIPFIFRAACLLSKSRVLGLTNDSAYVFESGKGITIRKPLANKDYSYYEKLVYQSDKAYQVCNKSNYDPGARTTWLRIISTHDLSEKLIELPGKFTGVDIEAMPTGAIWLMGNSNFDDKKSHLLNYSPGTGKITWTREINSYTTNWAPAKTDNKLYNGSGIGFVIDSAKTQSLQYTVPGAQNKIVTRISVQQSTGLVALYYQNYSDNAEVIIYNPRNNKVENQITLNSTSPLSQKLLGMQWHPSKKMFAFYVEDEENAVSVGTISFADEVLNNKPLITATVSKAPGIVLQDAHSFTASALSFNKNGSWMVSGDLTGRINIWDAKSKLIYNKIFLGGSGENNFQSTDRLPLAVHPTQKIFAVSFLQNYVYLIDFDGNYLDKITVNRYCNLLHFTDDGEYLILSTYNNPATLIKYNLTQKRVDVTNKNTYIEASGIIAGNFYKDSRYYYNPKTAALVKLNLLNGEAEKIIPFKPDKKIVLFDVASDEASAILLTEYLEFFHVDLTNGQSIQLTQATSHPMGTFQPGFNGSQTIDVPLVTFLKFAPDNAGLLVQLQYRLNGNLINKYYGITTAAIDKVNKRLGGFISYQQPLISTVAIANQMQPQTDYLWTGNDDGSIHLWDLRLNKQAGTFKGNNMYPNLLDANNQPDGLTLSMSSGQSGQNADMNQNFIRFDFGSAEINSINRKGFAPSFIYTATDKRLLTQNLDDLISIETRSKKEVIDTGFFYTNNMKYLSGHMLYATPKTICYYNAADQSLRWFENKKQLKSVQFPTDIPLKGKNRFTLDKWAFNTDSSKLYAKFTYVQFDDDGRYETGRTSSYYFYDIKAGKSTRLSLPAAVEKHAKDIAFTGNHLLYTGATQLYRYNFITSALDSVTMLKPISSFASDYRREGIYNNNSYAVTMYNLDTVRVFNQEYINAGIVSLQSFKTVAYFPLKYTKVEGIYFSKDNRLLYVLYHGELEIRSITSGKLVATLVILPGNKFIIYTPDNYYYASQKLTDIGFRTKGKIYSVEQFDLKYNRPDIVLKRLGYAPANLIDIYKKAYLKRLKRLNFTEERINDETEPPAIELVNRLQIPAKTTSGIITLKLRCTTPASLPDRISISVNDVPVFGVKGYKITGAKGPEHAANIEIKLMSGPNRIKYSVYNSKGVQSLSESIDVMYEPVTPVKPKVYFAGIGVSGYKDSRMNLKYADVDIKKMAEVIKAKYPSAEIISLLNADATVANIKQLKQKFAQTTVDDVIILYISGHGLLNSSADFFYATYETNFAAPDQTALPYKDIEGLLDGVPARKKLVMIDACHSGETDKSDPPATAALANNVKPTLTPGAKGFGASNKQKTGLQNSFMLMQNLFVDLNEGSGAMVISAAAGDSFALEAPQWNNGIFTYSVINGLKNNEADYNNDNKINLSELRKYVYETVSKETGGRQQPTTREENLGFDWQIW